MNLLHGMIALQGRGSLLFWPVEDVALIMEEYAGRVTVVSSRGEVAWRRGPASEAASGFLVEIRPGVFANPRHASHSKHKGRRKLVFPGGWSFDDGPPLKPAPAMAPEADPVFQIEAGGTRSVRASSIVYLERDGTAHKLHTTDGVFPMRRSARKLLDAHVRLVKLGSFQVNPRRLREIRRNEGRFHLRFDTGEVITISWNGTAAAARALGVPSLRRLDDGDGALPILYDEGLRDWPRLIMDMPAPELKEYFGGDRRMAIANVIWQVVRLRSLGTPPDYGTDHRGFWYLPLFPLLNKLDMMREAPLMTPADLPFFDNDSPPAACPETPGARRSAFQVLGGHSASASAYGHYQDILGDLVGAKRLFTYRDLGFRDMRPDLRGMGAVRPHVVLVVEKSSLLQSASEAARRFGITWIVLGGDSSWLGVEFFAEALRSLLAPDQRVKVVAYVDFDPAGWIIADSFIRQLARYGMETESLSHIVLPKFFTKAEIESVAYPIAAATESSRTLVLRWLVRSGGIRKRGFGIHSDHLRPIERIIKAIRDATGLQEAGA